MPKTRSGIEVRPEFLRAKNHIRSRFPYVASEAVADEWNKIVEAAHEVIKDVILGQKFPGANRAYSEAYEEAKIASVGHDDRLNLYPGEDDKNKYANAWVVLIKRKRYGQAKYRWEIGPDPKLHPHSWKFSKGRLVLRGKKSSWNMIRLAEYLEESGFTHREAVWDAMTKQMNAARMRVRGRIFQMVKQAFERF